MPIVLLSASLLGLVLLLAVMVRRIVRFISKCGSCRYQATLPCGIFCEACRKFNMWQPIDVEGE